MAQAPQRVPAGVEIGPPHPGVGVPKEERIRPRRIQAVRHASLLRGRQVTRHDIHREHARRARVVAVSSRREASARAVAQAAGLDSAFISTDLADVLARDDVQILSI